MAAKKGRIMSRRGKVFLGGHNIYPCDEDVDEALSDLQSIEVELLEVAEILSDSGT